MPKAINQANDIKLIFEFQNEYAQILAKRVGEAKAQKTEARSKCSYEEPKVFQELTTLQSGEHHPCGSRRLLEKRWSCERSPEA